MFIKFDSDHYVPGTVDGVTTGQIFIGFPGSTASIHQEGCQFHSILYLHPKSIGDKLWLVVNEEDTLIREAALKAVGETCEAFFECKSCFFSRRFFEDNDIGYKIIRQKPGTYVVLRPAVYHQVINVGFNVSLSMNYVGVMSRLKPDGTEVTRLKLVPKCTCKDVTHGDPYWPDVEEAIAQFEDLGAEHVPTDYEKKLSKVTCEKCGASVAKAKLKQHKESRNCTGKPLRHRCWICLEERPVGFELVDVILQIALISFANNLGFQDMIVELPKKVWVQYSKLFKHLAEGENECARFQWLKIAKISLPDTAIYDITDSIAQVLNPMLELVSNLELCTGSCGEHGIFKVYVKDLYFIDLVSNVNSVLVCKQCGSNVSLKWSSMPNVIVVKSSNVITNANIDLTLPKVFKLNETEYVRCVTVGKRNGTWVGICSLSMKTIEINSENGAGLLNKSNEEMNTELVIYTKYDYVTRQRGYYRSFEKKYR